VINKLFKEQSSRIQKWIICNVRYSLLYKEYCPFSDPCCDVLWCNTVKSGNSPTIRKNILDPYLQSSQASQEAGSKQIFEG
jgi:hypothetical protein